MAKDTTSKVKRKKNHKLGNIFIIYITDKRRNIHSSTLLVEMKNLEKITITCQLSHQSLMRIYSKDTMEKYNMIRQNVIYDGTVSNNKN